MEESIHTSFKEKKKNIDQNIRDLESGMENLSLNNDSQNQQFLQIATGENNDDITANFEPFYPLYVSDDILED